MGIFDAISDMDLWAPDKDANTYGARKKKKLGIGDIKAGKSYVPDGLTAAQYQELRKKQETSKKDNYQRNMSKRNTHGKYYEFYKERGTDLNANWAKSMGPDIPLRKRNMIGKVSKGNPLPGRIRKKILTSSATRKSRSLAVLRSSKNLTAIVPNNNDCIRLFDDCTSVVLFLCSYW